MQHVHSGRSTRHGLLASLGENPWRVNVRADGGFFADQASRWRREGLQVRSCSVARPRAHIVIQQHVKQRLLQNSVAGVRAFVGLGFAVECFEGGQDDM